MVLLVAEINKIMYLCPNNSHRAINGSWLKIVLGIVAMDMCTFAWSYTCISIFA